MDYSKSILSLKTWTQSLYDITETDSDKICLSTSKTLKAPLDNNPSLTQKETDNYSICYKVTGLVTSKWFKWSS